MRFLACILLAGCTTTQQVDVAPSSVESLHKAWEQQVDDSVATFTAIRPGLTGPDYNLKLFDVTLEGLIALSGSPTVEAVEQKVKLLHGADMSAIEAIKKKNKELDKKTTELEDKAKKAEERAAAAEQKLAAADERNRLNQLSGWISMAGAVGAMIGFLAFVFVPAAITPKWVSATAIPMSVGVAIFGHRLLEWLGTEWASYIIGGSAAFVLLNALAYFSWKLWCNAKNRLRRPKDCALIPPSE